jgi:nucleotide-binding universal stress UspA family protein
VFETILVAVDHSEHSRRAFQAAVELAKSTGGRVRVVHIRESSTNKTGPIPVFTDLDASLVEDSLKELTEQGVEATGVVYDSHHARRVASAILEEATDSGASLIVIGSRGLSDLVGLVVGSTTHKVLHLGTLPVLVVR